MSNTVVVTTFPNNMFEVYAKDMITSFVKYWPADIPLLIQLDDDLLAEQIGKMIRPQDAIATGWTQEHVDFVTRNKKSEEQTDYRFQTNRFCHKVFAIYRAYDAIKKQISSGGTGTPRYLVWMDADVITTSQVTDLKDCLPEEGKAVAYLGRKDWPHSEAGWLAFDLDNGGADYIEVMYGLYTSDQVTKLKETHDSWAWDHVRNSKDAPPATNLTEGKPGMDIWQHSPMGKWSTHYKGPMAKQNLGGKQEMNMSGIKIQTKNSIPDTEIADHISENQKMIKDWVRKCIPTDEEIVVVSAGPQMWPEDVLEDYNAGKKIVAVKHALEPLKSVGIKPWACVLLDPRPHVYKFIDNPDKDVLWFVASQVDPRVVERLLAFGCKVIGYHASVGANEEYLTRKQGGAIINGGSATATRGLFLLKHLGFKNVKLYGYDLCYPDKPDMGATDDMKQPRHLEISIGTNNPLVTLKKCFWTEPQLIAQFEEMNQLIGSKEFNFTAVGDGIVPFILKTNRIGDLRQARIKDTIDEPISYQELLKWNNPKKTNFLMTLLKRLR